MIFPKGHVACPWLFGVRGLQARFDKSQTRTPEKTYDQSLSFLYPVKGKRNLSYLTVTLFISLFLSSPVFAPEHKQSVSEYILPPSVLGEHYFTSSDHKDNVAVAGTAKQEGQPSQSGYCISFQNSSSSDSSSSDSSSSDSSSSDSSSSDSSSSDSSSSDSSSSDSSSSDSSSSDSSSSAPPSPKSSEQNQSIRSSQYPQKQSDTMVQFLRPLTLPVSICLTKKLLERFVGDKDKSSNNDDNIPIPKNKLHTATIAGVRSTILQSHSSPIQFDLFPEIDKEQAPMRRAISEPMLNTRHSSYEATANTLDSSSEDEYLPLRNIEKSNKSKKTVVGNSKHTTVKQLKNRRGFLYHPYDHNKLLNKINTMFKKQMSDSVCANKLDNDCLGHPPIFAPTRWNADFFRNVVSYLKIRDTRIKLRHPVPSRYRKSTKSSMLPGKSGTDSKNKLFTVVKIPHPLVNYKKNLSSFTNETNSGEANDRHNAIKEYLGIYLEQMISRKLPNIIGQIAKSSGYLKIPFPGDIIGDESLQGIKWQPDRIWIALKYFNVRIPKSVIEKRRILIKKMKQDWAYESARIMAIKTYVESLVSTRSYTRIAQYLQNLSRIGSSEEDNTPIYIPTTLFSDSVRLDLSDQWLSHHVAQVIGETHHQGHFRSDLLNIMRSEEADESDRMLALSQYMDHFKVLYLSPYSKSPDQSDNSTEWKQGLYLKLQTTLNNSNIHVPRQLLQLHESSSGTYDQPWTIDLIKVADVYLGESWHHPLEELEPEECKIIGETGSIP